MNLNKEQLLQKLKNLDPQTRYYIFGGGMLFVFLLNYVLILGPELRGLNNVNTKISEMTQNLQSVNNDILRLDQNRAQLGKLTQQVNDVKARVRSKQEIPIVLEDISRIANKYNVKIDQLMPLKDQQETLVKNDQLVYVALPILIQARAPYHDFGRFLENLESEKVFAKMGNFSISTNPKDPSNHLIQLTVKAVITEKPENKPKK